MCALRRCCSGCSHCTAAAQAEDFIQCRTQAEQLQLLNAVINSKDMLEALERECGKDKEEAGELCSGRLSCAIRGHYLSAPHSSTSEQGRTPPNGGKYMHTFGSGLAPKQGCRLFRVLLSQAHYTAGGAAERPFQPCACL